MKPWKEMKTAEKLERIKSAWNPGMSARDIMAAIGAPSRNAVIGYYTRYREELADHPLQGVGGVTARLSEAEKRRRAVERNKRYQASKSVAVSAKKRRGQRGGTISKNRLKPVPKPVIAKPVLVAPVTAGVSLMDLGPRQCKFCINEPEQGANAHLFCGEVTEPGKSWCAWHERVVWGRGTAGETVTVKSAERIAA